MAWIYAGSNTTSPRFRPSSTLVELPVQKLIAKGFITCQASGELKVFANSEHPTLLRLSIPKFYCLLASPFPGLMIGS